MKSLYWLSSLLIFECLLRWTSQAALIKHGLYWGASPIAGTFIASESKWQPIENSSMKINLNHKTSVLISYNLLVKTIPRASASPLPREDNKDTLQVRCIVNGVSYRSSSSFTSVYSVENEYLTELSAYFAVNLSLGDSVVSMEWKKSGKNVFKWVIAEPYFGSGLTMSAFANYKNVIYQHELDDVYISEQNTWKVLTKNLSFFLEKDSDVVIGYSYTALPQIGKFIKDGGIEYIMTRVVLNNVPYSLGSNIFGTSKWNPTTGNIQSIFGLKLQAGNYFISLEWKKVGYAVKNWLSAPSLYDGFASSRNIFILIGYATKNKIGTSRVISSGEGTWRTILNESRTIDLSVDSAVYISFALPVSQYSNPNFDNYTWKHLSSVSARLLIDNVPYPYSTNSAAEFSRSIKTVRGSLGLILKQGTHSIALQWRSDQNVNWMILNMIPRGFITSENLLTISASESSPPVLRVPTNTTTFENQPILVKGISLNNDATHDPEESVYLSISIAYGQFAFESIPLLANTSALPNEHFQIFEIVDCYTTINEILSSIIFYPRSYWFGVDLFTINVTDVTSYENYNIYKIFQVGVVHVDSPFNLTGPDRVNIDKYGANVSIMLVDIDSNSSQFLVEAFVSCGYLRINNNVQRFESSKTYGVLSNMPRNKTLTNVTLLSGSLDYSSSLSFKGLFESVSSMLKDLTYTPRTKCSQLQYIDQLSVHVVDLDTGISKSTRTQLIINDAIPKLSLAKLQYPRWYLSNLTLSNEDDNVVVRYNSFKEFQTYKVDNWNAIKVWNNQLNPSKSSLSLIALNNFTQYALSLQYGDDNIAYIDSSYLPIKDNVTLNLLVTKSIADNFTELFCNTGRYVYSAQIRPSGQLTCYINTTRENTYMEHSILWINVVVISSNSDREIFSSNFLPFYLTKFPKIIEVSTECLINNTYSSVELKLDSRAIHESFCLVDGIKAVESIVRNSTIICKWFVSTTNKFVSIAISKAGFEMSSSIVLPVSDVVSEVSGSLVILNSSTYVSIQMNYLQFCTQPKMPLFCTFNSSQVLPVNYLGSILCLTPNRFNPYTKLVLQFKSFNIDVKINGVPESGAVACSNCTLTTLSAKRLLTGEVMVYGFGFLLAPATTYCIPSFHKAVVLSDTVLSCGFTFEGNLVGLSISPKMYSSLPVLTINNEIRTVSVKPDICLELGCVVRISISVFKSYNSPIWCSFDDLIVSADIVAYGNSSLELECTAPPGRPDMSVTLTIISNNNQIDFYEISKHQIYYASLPYVESVSPYYGQIGKPTNISIFGRNFTNAILSNSILECECNFRKFPIIILSSTLANCQVTATSFGLVGLSVKILGSAEMNTINIKSFNFTAFLPLKTISVSPFVVSSAIESTVIVKSEIPIPSNLNIECIFLSVGVVVGKLLNSYDVECITPIIGSIQSKYETTVILRINDETSESFAIFFEKPISIGKVSPSFLFSIPGEEIFVTANGVGFDIDSVIYCVFEEEKVNAVLLSRHEIMCLSREFNQEYISFSVEQNGINGIFSNNNFTIQYPILSLPQVLSVYPSIVTVDRPTKKISTFTNFIATNDTSDISFEVTVNGVRLNTLISDRVECRFDEQSSPLLIVNDSHAKCLVSTSKRETSIALAVAVTSRGNLTLNQTKLSIQFRNAIILTSIFPSSGSIYGTRLMFYGSQFFNSTLIECVFDDVGTSIGELLDMDTIVCVSPKIMYNSYKTHLRTNVRLSLDGHFSSSLDFIYVFPPLLSHSDINFGPSYGDQNLTLFGHGFSGNIMCSFNDTKVEAFYLSATSIVCTTPSYEQGITKLTVIQNGDSALSLQHPGQIAELNYTFLNSPTIHSINPRIGSISGGTLVSVSGFNFEVFNESSLYCEFGSVSNNAELRGSTTIVCESPPMKNSGVVNFSILPKIPVFGVSGLFFRYVDTPFVYSIYPSSGSTIGNQLISLQGVFPPISDIYCIFLSIGSSRGVLVNPQRVECSVPSADLAFARFRKVNISLRLNHILLETDLQYTYIKPPIIEFALRLKGYRDQGTIVVHGNGFLQDSVIMCFVDYYPVLAFFISSTKVRCTFTNVRKVGNSVITLQQDGVNGITSENNTWIDTFEFRDGPKLYELFPNAGLNTGGLNITLIGSHFDVLAEVDLFCEFDELIRSPIVIMNASTVSCISPPYSSTGYSILRIVSDIDYNIEGFVLFKFFNPIYLKSLKPSFGFFTKSSPISVIGNFPVSSLITCKFGDLATEVGLYINSSTIECSTPSKKGLLYQNVVNLSVVVDGVESLNTILFNFIHPVIVHELFPVAGYSHGGSILTMIGENFDTFNAYYCVFDNQYIPAEYISPNEVKCIAPRHSIGAVTVRLSVEGLFSLSKNYSIFEQCFEFIDGPDIKTVFPIKRNVKHGDIISFSGEQLQYFNAGDFCVFGNISYPLLSFNETQVNCEVPKDLLPGLVQVGLDIQYGSALSSKYIFRVVEEIFIFAASQAFGSVFGGDELVVLGQGFYSSEQIFCEFGNAITLGNIINSTAVECLSPSYLEARTGNSSIVELRILFDDNYSQNFISFVYKQPPQILSSFPSNELIMGANITLDGRNFEDVGIFCFFNDLRLLGYFISPVRIVCPTLSIRGGYNKLRVFQDKLKAINTYNDQFQLYFNVIFPPSINSYYPKYTDMKGGTIVKFEGEGFFGVNSTDLSIYFENVRVSKWKVLSNTTLECVSPSLPEGKAQVVVYIENIILANVTINILDFNVTYSESVQVLPVKENTEFIFLGSVIYDQYSYSCEFNGFEINAIILNVGFLCSIRSEQVGNYSLKLRLDGYGELYETTVQFLEKPVINSALISSFNHKWYAVLFLENIQENIFWECVIGTYRSRAYFLSSSKSVWLCQVSFRFVNTTSFIYVLSKNGVLKSNPVIPQANFTYLMKIGSETAKARDIQQFNTKNISKFNESRLYLEFKKLNSLQDLRETQKPFVFPLSEFQSSTLPISDATVIRDLFFSDEAQDVKSACVINGKYPCLLDRSQYFFSSPLLLQSTPTKLNYGAASFTLDESTDNIFLIIESVRPRVVSPKNGSWVTIEGRYFRNTTICSINGHLLVPSFVIMSHVMQCFIPNKMELNLPTALNVTLSDQTLNITSLNSVFIFYEESLVPLGVEVIQPKKVNMLVSPVIEPAIDSEDSTCSIVNSMFDISNIPRVRSRELPLLTYLSYSNPKILESCFKLNISEVIAHALNNNKPMYEVPQSKVNDHQIQRTVLLSPTLLNIHNVQALYFQTFNSWTNIMCLLSNSIKERCSVENSGLVKCPLSVHSPGNYSISLLSNCTDPIYEFVLEAFNNSSPTEESNNSLFLILPRIEKVEPLVSILKDDYNISFYGQNISEITHCRFISNELNHSLLSVNATIKSVNEGICCLRNYNYSGLTALQFSVNNGQTWLPSKFVVKFIEEPMLLQAVDSRSFNSTIIVYGDFLTLSISVFCVLSFSNGASLSLPGIVVSRIQINCNGFEQSQSNNFIQSVLISFNNYDYFPVQFIHSYNLLSPGLESFKLVDTKEATEKMNSKFILPTNITAIKLCEGNSSITAHMFDWADLNSVECIFSSSEKLMDSNIQPGSLYNKYAKCKIPNLSPGKYEPRIIVSNSQVQVVQDINLYCVPKPVITRITLLPISVSDGSSTLKILGYGFNNSLECKCHFGSYATLAFVDSSYQMYCNFAFLVPNHLSRFFISIDDIIFFKDTYLLLRESDISFGLFNIFQPNTYKESRKDTNISKFSLVTQGSILTTSLYFGLSHGGSVVFITLDSFDLSYKYTCQFDDIIVPAEIVDFNVVRCITPPASPGNRTLTVVNSAKNKWCCSWHYFFPQPKILSSTPGFLTNYGNDDVLLVSSYLPTSLIINLYCYFGNYKVLACVLDNNIVKCSAPVPLVGDSVSVSIGSNQEVWSSSVKFPILNSFSRPLFSPMYGSRRGGTNVSIILENNIMLSPNCMFGNIPSNQSDFDSISSTLKCLSPAAEIGPVELRAYDRSFNNSPTLQLGFFYYEAPVDLFDVVPNSIPINSSSILRVSGSSFRDNPNLSCRIDSVVVKAFWLSFSKIECAYTASLIGQLNLQVSNNGYDWSNNISIKAYADSSVVHVAPLLGYSYYHNTIFVNISSYSLVDIRCRIHSSFLNSVITGNKLKCYTPLLSSGVYALSIENLNGKVLWNGSYDSIAVPIVNSSTLSIVAEAKASFFISGHNFDRRTKGYVLNFPICLYFNETSLKCDIYPQLRPNEIHLDLTVNDLDFYAKAVVILILEPISIISVFPRYLLSSGGVNPLFTTPNYKLSEVTLHCLFNSKSSVFSSVAYSASNGFICPSPSKISIGENVLLVLYQNDQALDQKFIFPVIDTPVITSLNPTTIFTGILTQISVTFKDPIFQDLDLKCIINSTVTEFYLIGLRTGRCIVQAWNVMDKIAIVIADSDNTKIHVPLRILDVPIDLSTNVSAVMLGSRPFIKISSPSCSINVSSASCKSSQSLTLRTISSNPCFVECQILKFKSNSFIDLNLCFDPTCSESSVFVKSLEIVPRAGVLSIRPRAGSVQGGTYVTLTGYGFYGNMTCVFGTLSVTGLVVSSTEVLCKTKLSSPGYVNVFLFREELDITGHFSHRFEYLPSINGLKLNTKSVSSEGGTQIDVFVSDLYNISNLSVNCRFGNNIVLSNRKNSVDQVITCMSPPLIDVDSVDFCIQVNEVDVSEIVSLQVISPPAILFVDPLQVRSNQQEYKFSIILDSNLSELSYWQANLDQYSLNISLEENILLCTGFNISFVRENMTVLVIKFANSLYKVFEVSVSQPSIIKRIFPLTGFLGSETSISLTFNSIDVNSRLTKCCFDNGDMVPAMKLSEMQLECYVPLNPTRNTNSSLRLGIGTLKSDNDCEFTGFYFNYYTVPRILSISSNSGSYVGGDVLDIMFYDQIQFNHIYCRIGEFASIGQIFGGNSVLCSTRQNRPGIFYIELSVNGVDFISTEFTYEYKSVIALDPLPIPSFQPKIFRISPNSFSVGQLQTIRIYGENFFFGAICILGNHRILNSVFVSNSELSCQLPVHSPGFEALYVQNPRGNTSTPINIYFNITSSVFINPGNSVSPPFGPLLHDTLITVFGTNLNLIAPQVLCLIGDSWAHAFDVTPFYVSCIAPPSYKAGRVSVKLANTNRDFIAGYGSYEYIDDPIVYNGHPVRGYPNSQVVLQGRGFSRYPSLHCYFEAFESKTTIFSDTILHCNVPLELDSRNYSILLRTNPQHYIFTGVTFTYLKPISITYIWPSFGPALRGGTIVNIYGDNFPNTVDIQCSFGNSRVSAWIVSNTIIQCLSPSHIPGQVSLNLFSDGTLLVHGLNSLKFTYFPDVSVSRVFPESGLFTGGYIVFVFGSNFMNSTSLACSFGGMKTRGLFISKTCIMCLSPSPIGRPPLQNFELVPVEVSNNGYDYSNSNVTFRFKETCVAGEYCFASTPYLTPNGTFTRNNANNFTLCNPGYFQPLQGQSDCLVCPVGYVCPDFGMSRPNVCPNGMICDTVGLISSQKNCPSGFYCLNATKAISTSEVLDSNFLYGEKIAWIMNDVTGVVTFNSSVIDYEYRVWPYPAYGRSRVFHPPESQCDGYDCSPGLMEVLAEAPFPCPIGYYCRTGVVTEISIPKNFSTPQRCFDGYFCSRGSISPEGSGPCPNGYFCPTQVDAIACPPGHYCPGVGNTAPIECYPGTYNPYEGRANCTVCPTGHICPGWGSLLPEPCPAGFVCMQLGLSLPVVLCPQGYYCQEGTLTMDPSDPTVLKPIPCPDRVFCLGGVASLVSVEWIATQPYGAGRPQLCSEGTYCESGAYLPSGSGLCFLGHYCPPNSSFPIATPIGNFASSRGSVAPSLCYPGTYAPLRAQISCLPCPSGFTCQSYGTSQPTLCGPGTYRAQVDAVVCIPCPQGTYGYESGAPDISICLPCPAPRICGITSLNNLNQTASCSQGYVCGHATPLSAQFSHHSPAGYYSAENTIPENAFSTPCESGFYCPRGTPDYLKTQAKCSIGYFCPPATSVGNSIDYACPVLTNSPIGSTSIVNCSIESVNVCDKISTEPLNPFQDVTYYATFSYFKIDGTAENITFNSSLSSTADNKGEVQVVTKILPINYTSSSPLWVNDTIEAFRACPSYGSSIGGSDITIIGRNFANTGSNFCKFRPCISANRGISLRRCRNQITDISGNDLPKVGEISNLTYIVPAVYISSSRMKCRVPKFVFDTEYFNPTIDTNMYTCEKINSTGLHSYVRKCDSSLGDCINNPKNGYEYFNSVTIQCTSSDIANGICANRPEQGYFFNPCISSEILIEVTNDGEIYSGGDNANGTYILSTVRYGDGRKNYRGFQNYSTNATFAEYTYILSDFFYTNPGIVDMDTNLCLQTRYSEESVRDREKGWFLLTAHDVAHVQIDLSKLQGAPNLNYGQDYRIALFIIPSRCDINICSAARIQLQPSEYLPCRFPREFSNWF